MTCLPPPMGFNKLELCWSTVISPSHGLFILGSIQGLDFNRGPSARGTGKVDNYSDSHHSHCLPGPYVIHGSLSWSLGVNSWGLVASMQKTPLCSISARAASSFSHFFSAQIFLSHHNKRVFGRSVFPLECCFPFRKHTVSYWQVWVWGCLLYTSPSPRD